jgi:hypothetical protein
LVVVGAWSTVQRALGGVMRSPVNRRVCSVSARSVGSRSMLEAP